MFTVATSGHETRSAKENSMAAKRAKKKSKKAKKTKAKRAVAKKARPGKTKARKAKKAPAKAAKRAKAKAPAKKAKKGKAKAKAAPRKEVFGEGNYTAAREFREEQTNFVKKNHSRIAKLGKDAEKALEGPEGDELRAAEEEAKSHAHVAGGEA